jgi:DNA-binding transcriptional LysR family regulator
MSDDLLSGRIVNVIPEYKPEATELWLICPNRQLITPAVRLLRDHLKAKCQLILNRLVEMEFIDPLDVA